MTIPFDNKFGGIKEVVTTAPGATRYFNLSGVEVDRNYRGIVISAEGNKLLK